MIKEKKRKTLHVYFWLGFYAGVMTPEILLNGIPLGFMQDQVNDPDQNTILFIQQKIIVCSC